MRILLLLRTRTFYAHVNKLVCMFVRKSCLIWAYFEFLRAHTRTQLFTIIPFWLHKHNYFDRLIITCLFGIKLFKTSSGLDSFLLCLNNSWKGLWLLVYRINSAFNACTWEESKKTYIIWCSIRKQTSSQKQTFYSWIFTYK